MVIENVDVDSSSETVGDLPSSKTTVIQTVEGAFNEKLSDKVRGSLASSKSSMMQ